MKLSNLNSGNLYTTLFHVADTNYELFLSEEKMNKLPKKHQLAKKNKMNGKMRAAPRISQ